MRRRLPGIVMAATLLALFALTAIAVHATTSVTSSGERLHRVDRDRLTHVVSTYLSDALSANKASMERLASRAQLRGDLPPTQLQRQLDQLGAQQTNAAGMAIVDVGRRQIALSTRSVHVPPLTQPGYAPMWGGLSSHGIGVSNVVYAGAQAQVAMLVSLPTASAANSPLALLAVIRIGDLGLRSLMTSFGAIDAGEGGYYVSDGTGIVLAERDQTGIGRPLPAAGHTEMVSFAAPIAGTNWTLGFRQPAATFYGDIRGNNLVSQLSLILLLCIACGALVYLHQRRGRVLANSANRLEALLHDVGDVVLVVDKSAVTYASPSVERALGVSPGSAVGKSAAELLGSDFAHALDLVAAGGAPSFAFDAPLAGSGSGSRWVEAKVVDRRGEPAIRGLVVALHDVTDRRVAHDQLLHESRHDTLTGLANRLAFNEAAGAAIDMARASGTLVAVVYLDLDGFKPVNDRWGHDRGDEMLRVLAARIAYTVRPSDLPARLGGDEFAVLLTERASVADAKTVAERLLRAVRQPVVLDGELTSVTASIGIAVTAVGADGDVLSLLQHADAAMYAAKRDGGNRHRLTAGVCAGSASV